MEDPIWIPKEVVLALHNRQLAEHGGATGIRDEALLESALARPQQLCAYGQPPPNLCALAAAYAFGLAKNHAFFDGNKRTAFVVYRLFLVRNGVAMTATKEDRYLSMWHLASGEHTEESFEQWLRDHTEPLAA
ncbi:MAG TPA: type II toxin-antitoxin system death-on-curing family toxin [Prosthecobacter sp.]|nr:type II toxin-antitoxin system death-on-curing family toxin [Prosthecobacter sp.]